MKSRPCAAGGAGPSGRVRSQPGAAHRVEPGGALAPAAPEPGAGPRGGRLRLPPARAGEARARRAAHRGEPGLLRGAAAAARHRIGEEARWHHRAAAPDRAQGAHPRWRAAAAPARRAGEGRRLRGDAGRRRARALRGDGEPERAPGELRRLGHPRRARAAGHPARRGGGARADEGPAHRPAVPAGAGAPARRRAGGHLPPQHCRALQRRGARGGRGGRSAVGGPAARPARPEREGGAAARGSSR